MRSVLQFWAVLLGEIIFGNAQRTGVVRGLKQNEVERQRNRKIYKTGKVKPAVVFFEKEVEIYEVHYTV